eukprot:TRINITY_DN3984_c0_g1_i1.p1 TRINITY_DN3984_c0_g1~~TRINITY_DN3984_c0_g1_i1.p1  ORF type:complete len:366 (+),score=42.17 TRINITY_DN3984_c0_g1_i1:1-1098(+)
MESAEPGGEEVGCLLWELPCEILVHITLLVGHQSVMQCLRLLNRDWAEWVDSCSVLWRQMMRRRAVSQTGLGHNIVVAEYVARRLHMDCPHVSWQHYHLLECYFTKLAKLRQMSMTSTRTQLIGDNKVGKTSVLHCHQSNKRRWIRVIGSTGGFSIDVDICDFSPSKYTNSAEIREVRRNNSMILVFDFAAAVTNVTQAVERLQLQHDNFFRIMNLSLPKNKESASLLAEETYNYPKVLLGNKTDLLNDIVDSDRVVPGVREELQCWAKNHGYHFYEVSCISDSAQSVVRQATETVAEMGVHDLLIRLTRPIDKLKLLPPHQNSRQLLHPPDCYHVHRTRQSTNSTHNTHNTQATPQQPSFCHLC